MPAALKATNEQLIESYKRLGNVHKVGAELGIRGTSAHERFAKLGVVKEINVFTDVERERLTREYQIFRDSGRLSVLAAEMNRTVPFLSRQARGLGLSNARAPKFWSGKWKYLTEAAARAMLDSFKSSNTGLSQYCNRHGYSAGSFSETMREHFPGEWEHVIESKYLKGNKYRVGRDFEYRIRDSLRKKGYFVTRSPASRSPLDLVAVKHGSVLFVQCKRGGALPPDEWNALIDLALSTGAAPVLAENPYPGKHQYWLLTERKDGTKRRQPMVPYEP